MSGRKRRDNQSTNDEVPTYQQYYERIVNTWKEGQSKKCPIISDETEKFFGSIIKMINLIDEKDATEIGKQLKFAYENNNYGRSTAQKDVNHEEEEEESEEKKQPANVKRIELEAYIETLGRDVFTLFLKNYPDKISEYAIQEVRERLEKRKATQKIGESLIQNNPAYLEEAEIEESKWGDEHNFYRNSSNMIKKINSDDKYIAKTIALVNSKERDTVKMDKLIESQDMYLKQLNSILISLKKDIRAGVSKAEVAKKIKARFEEKGLNYDLQKLIHLDANVKDGKEGKPKASPRKGKTF